MDIDSVTEMIMIIILGTSYGYHQKTIYKYIQIILTPGHCGR